MASIPGAMFRANKIHDDLNKFRKRSASDAEESRKSAETAKMNFRLRSISVTNRPAGLFGLPGGGSGGPGSPAESDASGSLSPAVSGDSIINFVSGFVGGFFPTQTAGNVGVSMESMGEENQNFGMRGYPNAGSITDLDKIN
jgi:hypothetical protein